MNQRPVKNYNTVLRPDKIRLNKRVYMFLFFLSISIILWLLIKLRYEYVSTITYKVSISELPDNKVVVEPDSLSATVKIKALGYNLLRYKLFKYYKPLVATADGFVSINGKNYILLSRQLDRFSLQLGADLTLLDVNPDTLYFQVSDVVQKRVTVKPDLKIAYAKQYMQAGGYTVTPARVKVRGPASVIDTLNFIYTQLLALENISDNIDVVLPIKPVKGISFQPSEVRVSVPVEKFTEAKVDVPVSCINVPLGYDVLISPKVVTLTCNVAVSKYFTLRPDHFTMVCDYNDLIKEPSGKAIVKLIKHPDFIGRIQLDPRKVDFVIVKRKQ